MTDPRRKPQETEPIVLPAPLETVPVATPAEAAPASILDLPAEVFRAGLDRRKANRGLLMDWIRTALVEGTDFGRIHTASRQKCAPAAQGRPQDCRHPQHWSKPSLFKPGAEKICGMLGVTVHYPRLGAYEEAALAGRSLDQIILRCELRDGLGRVVAEGVGARSVQQDYGDLNKAMKMAGKSAHIDATLRMAGLSEVFTQDLEDQRPPAAPAATEPPPERELRQAISVAELCRLDLAIVEYGLDRARVEDWVRKACKVDEFAELKPGQYRKLLKKLEQWAGENYARAASAEAAMEAREAAVGADAAPTGRSPGGNRRAGAAS